MKLRPLTPEEDAAAQARANAIETHLCWMPVLDALRSMSVGERRAIPLPDGLSLPSLMHRLSTRIATERKHGRLPGRFRVMQLPEEQSLIVERTEDGVAKN